MRKKTYEDKLLLEQLEIYWKDVCNFEPGILSYPGFSRFLEDSGINFTANAMKHREAIIEAMKNLKEKGTFQKKETTESLNKGDDNSELADRYVKLVMLYADTFSKELCTQLLIERGDIPEQELGLKPGFVKDAICRANDNPFSNKYIGRLAECAGLLEDDDNEFKEGTSE